MSNTTTPQGHPQDIPPDDVTPAGYRPVRASRPQRHVDADAEASIIGTILLVPEVLFDIADILKADDFGVGAHREIYTAMLACEAEGLPYDTITLADRLRVTGKLGRAGGTAKLEALLAASSDPSQIVHHARIVAEKSLLRSAARVGSVIVDEAMAADATGERVVESAEKALFSLSEQHSPQHMKSMYDAVADTMALIAGAQGGASTGVSTGMNTLDEWTGGLRGGQMLVLAARPSVGKSALGLQIAHHVAATSGDQVIFVSYEMTAAELVMRQLAALTGLSSSELRQGLIPTDRERDLVAAAERLSQLPLLIDDHPPERVLGLRSAVRRQAKRRPVGLVVVDYLQLVGSSRNENRTQEVGDVSRQLKRMSLELDVPVIAISQLNRSVEMRGDPRPNLSDLRDSGSIEQDADLVAFITRPVLTNPDADPSFAELILAKHRGGRTGSVRMTFFPEQTRFEDRGPLVRMRRNPDGGHDGIPF